jgi:hypothetical protein
MKDGVLHNEIEYRGYLITVHKVRGLNVQYYASVMELGYVAVSYDADISIKNAMLRIDTEYSNE